MSALSDQSAFAGVERYLTDALTMFDAGKPDSARAYVVSALADLRRAFDEEGPCRDS